MMCRQPQGSRKIPLESETVDLLERQEQEFIKKFGRKPGSRDPVFFDPRADEPRLIIDEVLHHHLLEAMERVDIHPSLNCAYQKTGGLLTRDNQQFLPPEDRQKWQDASNEWDGTHEAE